MATKEWAIQKAKQRAAQNEGKTYFVVYEPEDGLDPSKCYFLANEHDLATYFNGVNPENIVYSTEGD